MALDLMSAGAAFGFMTARHAKGSFIAGGVDILAGLGSQSILAFSYTDNTSDKADDISIHIADPQRTWMQQFLPKKGIECQASLQVFNWMHPGDTRKVDCGVFWLDQIDCQGPPNVVTIKGTSIPVTTGIKTQNKFRSWEDTDLYSVISQLATENGLALVWDSAKLPKKKRIDQAESPDLEFIRDKAKECSLSVKIFKKQLVVYSEEEYEARPPAYTIIYGASNILAYAFSSKLNDTYKSAKNSYLDPDTGDTISSTFTPDEPPEGSDSDLISDQRDEEEGEGDGGDGGGGVLGLRDFSGPTHLGTGEASDELPKSKLREKNKHEKTATFTVIGNPGYLSGLNIQLIGFGIFDTKWFIESSVHDIGNGGYTTQLHLRAALNGY
jgi:uncharacterized protein